MKLVSEFTNFIENTVNLNKSRIQQLEDRVSGITQFLRDSSWLPQIQEFVAHGSWAHETIIKPIDNNAFDADLIVFVNPVHEYEAKDYFNSLIKILRDSGVYKDKVQGWPHCATLEYANQFKIDVAPCVINRQYSTQKEVCNRETNEYEASRPIEYTNWIKQRNIWSGNHGLSEVTRLLKYLRDIKTRFTCKSILLTTLVGSLIYPTDVDTNHFIDLPTSLRTIFSRLDNVLQSLPRKPAVLNPVLETENFSNLWTDDQYKNFREMINKYRKWVDDAFDEENYDESVKKWRRLFGEDFAKGEVISRAASGITKLLETLNAGDLVEAVKYKGREILNMMPSNFLHVQKLNNKWDNNLIPVRIKGFHTLFKGGTKIGDLISGGVVPKGICLEFDAIQANGTPFLSDYKVKWQVVNTGDSAISNNCLRGEFNASNPLSHRSERTQYRGAHWVQAYVINKRTDLVVGVSDRFFVVVE